MSADDRLEIMEVVARYAYAWDAKDAAAYAACFTEDAELAVYTRGREAPAISERGRDAIESWARRSHSGELEGMREPDAEERTRHAPGGVVFDALEGDAAQTRAMLFETRVSGGRSTAIPQISGVYTDEWRRTAEGWRLSRRVLRMDRQ
ncbi:MAG: nuclear transport factor 2 family protein [Chloroflexi bacterium]|nr:nuclear transport factor 2 family protein [Chloroflexota bacterium]